MAVELSGVLAAMMHVGCGSTVGYLSVAEVFAYEL